MVHRRNRLNRFVALGLAVALTVSPTSAIQASEKNWGVAGEGSWTTPANWSPSGMPTASDWVHFRTTDPMPAAEMSIDSSVLPDGSLSIQTLTFDLNTDVALGSGNLGSALLRLVGPAVNNPNTDLIAIMGAGDFSIQPIVGFGSGPLGLQLAANGSFRVAQTGTKLSISSIISEFSSNSPRSITKLGLGTLQLSATNTYSGATHVSGGLLILDGDFGSIASKSISINGGATLRIDNSLALNTNRIDDAAQITLNGGTLEYIGNATGGTENIGSLRVTAGASTIAFTGTWNNVLSSAGITPLAGGTLTLTGLNADNRFVVSGQTSGLLPAGVYVTSGSVPEFATYSAGAIVAVVDGGTTSDYAAGTTLTANRVNRPTADVTQAAALTILGLRLSDFNVAGAGALTFNATAGTRSGILKTGLTATTIANPITIGATELVIRVDDAATGTLAINGIISGAAKPLTKTGAGTLILNTANAYTGPTYINQGTLRFGVNSASMWDQRRRSSRERRSTSARLPRLRRPA
ncbi:MAG: autotransporter-associated beta strand repeat-containing protein [Pirellulales bacterium]